MPNGMSSTVADLGLLPALLGDHVELGDPVLLHRHGERDAVLLDQHPDALR